MPVPQSAHTPRRRHMRRSRAPHTPSRPRRCHSPAARRMRGADGSPAPPPYPSWSRSPRTNAAVPATAGGRAPRRSRCTRAASQGPRTADRPYPRESAARMYQSAAPRKRPPPPPGPPARASRVRPLPRRRAPNPTGARRRSRTDIPTDRTRDRRRPSSGLLPARAAPHVSPPPPSCRSRRSAPSCRPTSPPDVSSGPPA